MLERELTDSERAFHPLEIVSNCERDMRFIERDEISNNTSPETFGDEIILLFDIKTYERNVET